MYLYDAIIALGRSLQDVRAGHWVCGTIGVPGAPSCANGLLSLNLGAQWAVYPSQLDLVFDLHDQEEVARVALTALIDAAPAEALATAGYKSILKRNRGKTDLESLESIVIGINDAKDDFGVRVLDVRRAAQWFSDALDLLAKQLPDPLPTLTAEDVLYAPTEARALVTA